MRIKLALTKRGLALEMGQVLSFFEHEKPVAFLFRKHAGATARLQPCNLAQLYRTDLEVFRQLQEKTKRKHSH